MGGTGQVFNATTTSPFIPQIDLVQEWTLALTYIIFTSLILYLHRVEVRDFFSPFHSIYTYCSADGG